MYIGYTINVLKNRQAAKAIKNDAKNTKKRLSKDKDYILDDPTEIQHVDEALKLLTVMTGDNRYEKILFDKEGVTSMCDVAERLENRGRAEGRAEGEAKLGKLIDILMEKGLQSDIKKAATDEKARQELYRKYGID